MKTLPLFVKKFTRSQYLMPFIFALITLSSCSGDDDQGPSFFGSYAVEDVKSHNGETYNYDITVEDATNGELNLLNFANLLRKPVKAKLHGTILTINSQTFYGQDGETLDIYGSGTVSGNEINFTYTATGALEYTGTCIARKK